MTLDSRLLTFYDIGMDQGDTVHATDGNAGRRSFLVRLGAIICGGIVALFPVAVGWGVIVDPWRRSRRRSVEGDEANSAKYVRICSLDALPANGTPQAFPVVSDVVDAWTRAADQRIGMVFLSRSDSGGKSNVVAFNARCPHLGCFVDFNPADGHFECPCHTSAFAKDGVQLYGPSRRNLDSLLVKLEAKGEQTDILVAFQNFQTGISQMRPM